MRKLDRGIAARIFEELGYLLVLLGELVDEGGERWRIGSARPLVTVYLGVYHPVYQPISSPKRKAGKNQSAFGSVIST